MISFTGASLPIPEVITSLRSIQQKHHSDLPSQLGLEEQQVDHEKQQQQLADLHPYADQHLVLETSVERADLNNLEKHFVILVEAQEAELLKLDDHLDQGVVKLAEPPQNENITKGAYYQLQEEGIKVRALLLFSPLGNCSRIVRSLCPSMGVHNEKDGALYLFIYWARIKKNIDLTDVVKRDRDQGNE